MDKSKVETILERIIMEEDNNILCLEPTEAKVKEASSSIPKQSSLGLDNFGFEFYSTC